jgi:hypothetical protein
MAKKKEPRLSILAHYGLINRPGSSVSKEKQAIFSQADKDIQKETLYPRTKQAISQAETSGVSETLKSMSDPERRKREIAKATRKKLAALGM